MLADESMTLLAAQLDYLTESAARHFGHEERLMEESGYPDLASHRNAHAVLLAELWGIKQQLLEKGSSGCTEAMQFTKNWLLAHIASMDKKLGLHLAPFSPIA